MKKLLKAVDNIKKKTEESFNESQNNVSIITIIFRLIQR